MLLNKDFAYSVCTILTKVVNRSVVRTSHTNSKYFNNTININFDVENALTILDFSKNFVT